MLLLLPCPFYAPLLPAFSFYICLEVPANGRRRSVSWTEFPVHLEEALS